MASIRPRADKFRVQIRRKGKKINALFADKELAEIFAKYHEELTDNIENFQVPPENMITIEQCLELKLEECRERNLPHRTILDYENLRHDFRDLMLINLGELDTSAVKIIANDLLKSTTQRGGSRIKENTGRLSQVSPSTILRKLRCLAAVVGFMIEKGADMNNPVQVVVNQIKMSLIKKGISTEE